MTTVSTQFHTFQATASAVVLALVLLSSVLSTNGELTMKWPLLKKPLEARRPRRSRSGKEAFLQAMNTHARIIHKVCWLFCNQPADAKDLKQEILMNLWEAYPSFGHD
jgi:hypothetical protein